MRWHIIMGWAFTLLKLYYCFHNTLTPNTTYCQPAASASFPILLPWAHRMVVKWPQEKLTLGTTLRYIWYLSCSWGHDKIFCLQQWLKWPQWIAETQQINFHFQILFLTVLFSHLRVRFIFGFLPFAWHFFRHWHNGKYVADISTGKTLVWTWHIKHSGVRIIVAIRKIQTLWAEQFSGKDTHHRLSSQFTR